MGCGHFSCSYFELDVPNSIIVLNKGLGFFKKENVCDHSFDLHTYVLHRANRMAAPSARCRSSFASC